jgi:hypothetical protein
MHHVITFDRVHLAPGKRWARSIDFRHIINSLAKKPQAFRNACLRDDLLPNDIYKYIWKYVDKTMDSRAACKFIVGLLHLAARENCIDELADIVVDRIDKKKKLCLKELHHRFTPKKESIPSVKVAQHSLQPYNALIATGRKPC